MIYVNVVLKRQSIDLANFIGYLGNSLRSVKFIRKIAVLVCLLLSIANCYGDQKLSKDITKQVEQEVIHVFNGLV